MFIVPENEQFWLKTRNNLLTASDAGSYCGLNPYDSFAKLHLWEVKTKKAERADLSDKEAVVFGKKAEEHLRALFLLKHPEYDCQYSQFGLWKSDDPDTDFMACTLDGLLINKQTQEKEILEIKTGTVQDFKHLQEWKSGDLPINYYLQILHQMYCIPESIGVWVYGLITLAWSNEQLLFEIHKDKSNADIQADTKILIAKAKDFWALVMKNERPKTEITL